MAIISTTVAEPSSHFLNSEVDEAYALTPDQAYDAWCVAYGVSSAGTDQNIDTIYQSDLSNKIFLIPTNGHPYSETFGFTSNVALTADGTVSFRATDVVDGNDVTYISVGGDNYVYFQAVNKPTLAISQIPTTFDYGTYGAGQVGIYNGKVRITPEVTLIRLDSQFITHNENQLAIKITKSNVEVVTLMTGRLSGATQTWDAAHSRVLTWDAAGNHLSTTNVGRIFEDVNQRVVYSLERYTVEGSIDENTPLSKFDVSVFDYSSGVPIEKAELDTSVNSTFEIGIAPAEPVMITVRPKALVWTPNTVLVAGDVIFPTDPNTTPYYFIVSVGGTTGTSEPTWITEAGTVVDNTVTFTWADRMVAPVTNAPVIPQLVV